MIMIKWQRCENNEPTTTTVIQKQQSNVNNQAPTIKRQQSNDFNLQRCINKDAMTTMQQQWCNNTMTVVNVLRRILGFLLYRSGWWWLWELLGWRRRPLRGRQWVKNVSTWLKNMKDILIKEFNNTSEGMLELAKVTWCKPTLGTATLKEWRPDSLVMSLAFLLLAH